MCLEGVNPGGVSLSVTVIVGLCSTLLGELAKPTLPLEEQVKQLRAELQRCLGSLKAKRQRMGQLQQELQASQSSLSLMNTQLHPAQPPSPVSSGRWRTGAH